MLVLSSPCEWSELPTPCHPGCLMNQQGGEGVAGLNHVTRESGGCSQS